MRLWGKPEQQAPPAPELIRGPLAVVGSPAWLMGFRFFLAVHVVGYVVFISPAFKGSALQSNPMLAAHFLPQLLGFAALAYYGGGAWMTEMPAQEAPIDAYLYVGERVSCIMIAFQLYELAACIPTKRLRGLMYEMVGHHAITLLLSVLAYKYQAYHYWAPCFMGMAEISSIPLAFVDLFKQFKPLKAQYPIICEGTRHMFAYAFLFFRGFYWPYSSIWFWFTSSAVLAAGTPLLFPSWVVYTFCVCNVLMTGLQWYWTSLILKAFYFLIIGDERHKDQ